MKRRVFNSAHYPRLVDVERRYRQEWHARRLMLQRESYSDIPVLKIISVLVSIKFELNHFSISFYTVAELFSVLVSIKILEIISVQFQSQYLHHFSNSFCHRQ